MIGMNGEVVEPWGDSLAPLDPEIVAIRDRGGVEVRYMTIEGMLQDGALVVVSRIKDGTMVTITQDGMLNLWRRSDIGRGWRLDTQEQATTPYQNLPQFTQATNLMFS
jgi:hypothetical protein